MRYLKKGIFNILLIVLLTGCGNSSKKEINNNSINPGSYELVKDWPELTKDYTLSQVSGVDVDSSQNVFLFHRNGRRWTDPFPDTLISGSTILMLDRETGNLLNAWGANYFIMPHGLTVDRENNVYVTDVGLHQIFKFSHEGKLLLKLGEAKVPGMDSSHFDLPTDVAVADDGSFYVSDGYGNSRVVKFSKEGHYLFEWGKRGDKPGEFYTPHGIDLDSYGNVYVADRDNNRIQKFDANGTFLMEWKNSMAKQLYSLTVDKRGNDLFAIDYLQVNDTLIKGSDIIKFDASLNLLHRFGRSGFSASSISRYHDIAIDNEGSIYVGDHLSNRIQKFKKRLSE